jgi:glutathione S-transferase
VLIPKGSTTSIPGSQTICEWLNIHTPDPKKKILPPADTDERIEALALQQLGDGLLDAALLVRYERLVRPQEVS